jgi:hypothetical protein
VWENFLLADSYNISKRLRNYSSQLLGVHIISDVRKMEIHEAQPLVPAPISVGVEIGNWKDERSRYGSNFNVIVFSGR